MKRLAFFSFIAIVAALGYLPIQAQKPDTAPHFVSIVPKLPENDHDRIIPPKFTNSFGMQFVWISPGTFLMGSPKEEKEREPDETQHQVTLTRGFYMGVHLVTQDQWQGVMGDNPSKFLGKFLGEKNLPVDNVSWDDCQVFVKKLREKDKKPYRLPTEAEWEYSCRAGTRTPFYFGETLSTDQVNYDGSFVYGNGIKGVYRKRTTPVGILPANAWGLFDMHGNLAEWCQDWFEDFQPNHAVDPQGPENGSDRIARGGSWYFTPATCRSARRLRYPPGGKDEYSGVRVCFRPD